MRTRILLSVFGVSIMQIYFVPQYAIADPFDFSNPTPEEISFSDIPKTEYKLQPNSYQANVNKSSSVLLYPFSSPKRISTVSITWRTEGTINIPSSELEQSKKGDDAQIRLGLILSGPTPFVPFFAPAWVKKVQKVLKMPTNHMIYLIAGAKTADGKEWENPYSGSITNISMHNMKTDQGWTTSQYKAKSPHEVVGIWMHSDGDDTKSSFKIEGKNLLLE